MKYADAKAQKSTARLFAMMLSLLIVASMTGCARFKVISQDREILRFKAGQTVQIKNDGWFVPDATWKDLNEALADKLPK